MYSLRRLPVWLSRIRYCRGFGVHSPWTYSFICDVINEHNPYYSYKELKSRYPDIQKRTRKLCELYFRISNFCQAANAVDFMPESNIYKVYMSAGCKKMKTVSIVRDSGYEDILESIGTIDLARMSLRGNYRRFYRVARKSVHDGTIFIIQGIKRNEESKRFWRKVVADNKCAVTLDLYYCGIIYFDSKRYKQNYIVNF